MIRNANSVTAATARDVNTGPRRSEIYFGDPADRLLARLDRVRKSGRGWTARCPAHEDRTASLSVTVANDGRVLLHCFAGCSAADVVAVAGLELADLFVRRPAVVMSYAERAALRENARQVQWRAALNTLSMESKIVVIAGQQIKSKLPLSSEDERRLDEALWRIEGAREVLCERL